jgi:hypothetical protein
MVRGEGSALPVRDERAWEVLVDAALPTVWSTAKLWGLTVDQAGSVCDAVMLRLLDMFAADGDLGSAPFTSIVRRLSFEECERERRLRAWAGAPVPRVIDLTNLEPDRVTLS